jgi:hypothetical protein
MDKEFIQIRIRIEQLTLKMQQQAEVHWRYEWPLSRKEKWLVQNLLARKKKRGERRWLRHAENLSDTEHEMVYIFEPEVGRTLSDDEGRSDKSLMKFQEGRDEFLNFHMGNEMGSMEDIIDC